MYFVPESNFYAKSSDPNSVGCMASRTLFSVKKGQPPCAHSPAGKQKTGARAVSITVPAPVSAIFSYMGGYFAPIYIKNLSCPGRQKRFLSYQRVTKPSRIEVIVRKSSAKFAQQGGDCPSGSGRFFCC